ncbi:hypothetical protein CERSUDRAFT_98163 [Gelatoporia subvermispora B]|uniref:Uncharacterized protein n=1 Tax=Ceriporiopsis subvermispora (strain B) TaxID=914234 RepID=M2QN41_CERS8|nr:hypothetical protein CERSUDRAFT_98163 [Gelatoporia subvermispora B]
MVAGLAGGATVALAGYAYYHFSGTKKAVDAGKSAHASLQETKRTIQEKAPKSANEVLDFLRGVTKTYVGMIPGASKYVDSTFGTLDQLRETHGEDVERILNEAYDEIRKVLSEGEGVTVETGMKIMGVFSRRIGELDEIARRAGQDVLQSLGEKHPEIADKLGGAYGQLRKFAEQGGPEGKRILDETTQQIKEIFNKGFSEDSIAQARELLQSKSSQLRDLADSSSREAWDKAMKQAAPYLDKAPELKQFLTENASKLMQTGLARGEVAQELWSRVREAAEAVAKGDKKKLEELKGFVQDKAREAGEDGPDAVGKGWQSLKQWLKTVPGGEEALKKMPDVDALVKISQERGEDARDLLRETYEDVAKVLQDKAQKAKSLNSEVKEEAKKQT